MIPAESRMREIRTSGSTSGGVETDRMGAGLSTKRKRGQEAPDPTRHRATPRLYSPPPQNPSTEVVRYWTKPATRDHIPALSKQSFRQAGFEDEFEDVGREGGGGR